jgi:putative DNA primase/helicase
MLLQEYIGYILSGRTDMQKMLLLIGPTRSGKGTIARMLAALVGRGHVVGPTLASLGTNFGLSPLLGRPLAVVSDARLSGNSPTSTIVERLLSITGEDMLTVDRKYREPWSGKLPSRFVILSNELPKFRDSSGAIANRLLILQMTNSFLGREDQTLDGRLADELPGILMWALEGLDRLVHNGRFTVPGASADAATLMMDLASPMSAFVRDRCVRKPNANVVIDDIYAAWKDWAEENGHIAGAKSTFGRDLRAVVPELKLTQPVVNGFRVRQYERIGLRSETLDADIPVHPVRDGEFAGHHADAGDDHRVHPVQHPMQPDQFAQFCTGCGALLDATNMQVNGGCTGCTGKSASKIQHRADKSANAAYLNGQCIDCKTRKHSAGRPRCDECHRIWQTTVDGYQR